MFKEMETQILSKVRDGGHLCLKQLSYLGLRWALYLVLGVAPRERNTAGAAKSG